MALVVVFLRGGADGLNMVVPHGEAAYLEHRPTIGIAEPLDLDGFFGLHPALAPLLPLWEAEDLAVVHAVGSDDTTRSHFDAQDRMEHAGGNDGWLARWLRRRPEGPLAAVAIGPTTPESLRGAPAAAIASLDDYRIDDPDFLAAMELLYDAQDGPLHAAGRTALAAMDRIARLDVDHDATYPEHAFGRSLQEVARLLRADCGLQVATVDLGGWDTHFVQAGLLEERCATLASGLAAFHRDVGEQARVVVMTEFGRRVHENVSLGTDHGMGSVAFVLGHGIAGGRVLGDWPGLAHRPELGAHDLPAVNDFRDVLTAISGATFPGHTPRALGLLR